MRIGIDARMYSSGFTGIGRYVFELVRHLAKLDDTTEYVCFLNPVEFEFFRPLRDNFRAVKVNAPHYSFAEQTQFLSALKKEKLDLMHFTHFNAPLFYRQKSVVTIHDLTLSFFPGKKMTKFVHRFAYNLVLRKAVQHASHLIAVSENTKKDLRDLLQTPAEKIEVISNGVGKEFQPGASTDLSRQQIRKKWDIRNGYLLYTGVWRDHKNLVGLIDAMGELTVKNNFTGQLVITGRPDPIYAPEVYAAVEKNHLENTVIFTGLVSDEDLLQLYQNARVFVLPSFYEGFGLPPLEAMACGIPVAVSNVSSIPEVCGDGNAVFFDPHNINEMAAGISRAWNDEALRKNLRERGLRRAAEFSWEHMARETLAVYREILGT